MERTARISGSLGGSFRLPKRLLAMRSDERLVEIFRAGEESAFELLYERHAGGVLGFCRHMLGSHEEAEDAAQQTFVSAHRALLRDDREMSFKAWLFTIARNTSLSMLRARREQASEAFEPPSTTGLAEEVERRSDLRQLVAGLQDLPDDQRAALVLTELADLSHTEVAEVLGCEVSAVKGVVFRARSALMKRRQAWEADCGDIREELAVARGGTLRRGRLKHHMAVCPGCVAYFEEVRRQRKLFAIGLPVIPTLALKESVMTATGIGASSAAGAAGAGALTSGGGAMVGSSMLGGTVAKVAIVGVLVGGAGVATEAAIDSRQPDRAPTPSGLDAGAANGSTGLAAPGAAGAASKKRDARARRDAAARERAQRRRARRAALRKAAAGKGLARGRSEDRPGLRRGQSVSSPGRPIETGRPAAPPRATPPQSQGRPSEGVPPSPGKDASPGAGRAEPRTEVPAKPERMPAPVPLPEDPSSEG